MYKYIDLDVDIMVHTIYGMRIVLMNAHPSFFKSTGSISGVNMVEKLYMNPKKKHRMCRLSQCMK